MPELQEAGATTDTLPGGRARRTVGTMTDWADHRTPSSVRIASTTHRIHVIAEHRDDVIVRGNAEVSTVGVVTTVADVRSRVTVRVPVGTDLVIGSESGRIEVAGRVGGLAALTETGRIEIERAASVDARTSSGRVEIGHCEGECRVRSESGRVQIDACGGADVATTTARIDLSHVTGPVRAHCVSGRIELSLDDAHDVDAETVTGRVNVAMPEGTNCFVSDVDDEPPEGYDCVVNARSVTGRVQVTSG